MPSGQSLRERYSMVENELLPLPNRTKQTARDAGAPPKLSDVARLAGVGNATVSRVLNGRVNVSADKIRRVNAAIESLSYTPDRIARSLKGARSGMIGVIVPSISDMFFSRCAEAVEKVARKEGSLLVVMASHDDPEIEYENVQQLVLHRMDGLILSSAQSRNPKLHKRLRELRVPVVGLDRPLQQAGLPSVLCENFNGAMEGTEHLLAHGYRTILCMHVKPELYTIHERVLGYTRAMENAGLAPLLEVIRSPEEARNCLLKHTKSGKKNIAAFVANNLTARYAWEALRAIRLESPRQVALLCFDDFDLANTLTPAMSVVQQPVDDLGRYTAELLFRQMRESKDGRRRLSSDPVCLPTQLVLRRSCGCPADI